MKILLIKFRHIGDVLLSTPLIENLAHHYPGAHIDYALNQDCAEMITLNPHIRNVITYDRAKIKKQNVFARIMPELRFAWRIRRGRYDMVISLTEGDRSALLALLCGAPLRLGFAPPKGIFHYLPVYRRRRGECKFDHAVTHDLQFISLLGKKIISKKVAMYCAKSDEDAIAALLARHQLNKFIHVHAVSRWMYKCIADRSMARVIDYCHSLGYRVVMTASPDAEEMKKTGRIAELCKTAPLNLAGALTLKQTGALNRSAAMFIGVDTAIMHMSAANDTPTFAFFGPSFVKFWGPWDNQIASGYARENGIQRMGKHLVFSESRACQPCGSDGCNHSQISDCLMSLDFARIKISIDQLLESARRPAQAP